MANRFMDSCDHYATADIAKKYTNKAGDCTIVTGGRTGNALQIKSDGATSALCGVVLDEQPVWYVGFALKLTDVPNDGTIVGFSTGVNQNMQCGVMLTPSAQLVFCDASRNVIGTVNGGTLSQGIWYYIEVKMMFKASISVGDCVIRVNAVTVATLDAGTKTNYASGSPTTASGIGIGTYFYWLGSTSLTALYDDIYINDGTGTTNNGFLGDITVDTMFTSSIGTYQDFTVVGTTTSVLATTDRAPDGDTTYVWSSTPNARESFLYTQPNYSINTVYAVQLLSCVEKSAAGTRVVYPFTRTGITNYEQASTSISTGYLYTKSVLETDPSTGLAWTETAVKNIEAGVRIA